jgi:hypothetical protein
VTDGVWFHSTFKFHTTSKASRSIDPNLSSIQSITPPTSVPSASISPHYPPQQASAYSPPTTPTIPAHPNWKTHKYEISRTIETTTISETATAAEVAAVSWEAPDSDNGNVDNVPTKKRRRWGIIRSLFENTSGT